MSPAIVLLAAIIVLAFFLGATLGYRRARFEYAERSAWDLIHRNELYLEATAEAKKAYQKIYQPDEKARELHHLAERLSTLPEGTIVHVVLPSSQEGALH